MIGIAWTLFGVCLTLITQAIAFLWKESKRETARLDSIAWDGPEAYSDSDLIPVDCVGLHNQQTIWFTPPTELGMD